MGPDGPGRKRGVSVFFEKVYKEWLQYRYKYLALTSDIKSLLQDLREHFLLGLITNGPSASQWEKVDKLNIRSYFDVILVSGDFPWEKPHYKIFHKACDYLGVQPRQCIMVGDKLETDILGGLQANLGGTVWIPLSRSELDQGHPVPHHIIKNIGELVDLLPEAKTRRRSFRGKTGNSLAFNKLSLCDIDDGNSNSSDGS
ncbi:N-acylneuraminate-9-phosphatase [Cylas formicarius]|uniref:N-acylneuraminate-9-phosphatase n=1 Tax=Cylas formicarius TaxID=197179 RepID=UPI0029587C11|nr:N-acylneuraminate-9-phosphatase [Cylas formicarius]